ncbi:MAG TPA: phosphatidylserine decarboxylase family protein [Syntrophales bacterium]|nr:phosphatidylserine decarboxylase family protein [Syntrophales bacterium]
MNHNTIIVREGLPFIIPLGIFTLIFFSIGIIWAATIFFIAACFVSWFFRNPERKFVGGDKAVTSPADGRVLKIENVPEGNLLKTQAQKVSIFMNVFDVHVNRAPYSGTVEKVKYDKGVFFSANLDKASELNEKNAILIKTDGGKEILTVQIAGLIARRIECWLTEGMRVRKGERFGLIRFGSRLEVFLPCDAVISVRIGDRVRAGETLIGWLK